MLPLLAIGFAPQRPLPTAAAARQRAAASLVRASADMAVDRRVDCIVVGAGISGSTLAHNLHRGGADVLLAEARDYVGGNVVSHEEDGFVWEDGPNSFATQPSIVRISHELGIEKELVFADESLPPWVNHNGKLHPLPKGKGGKGPKGQLELVFGSNGVLKFGLSGSLLSWPGKIRAAIGALVGHAPPPEGKEETIREWVTRTLGEEVFLRCIDPFVSGVYAGDPMTLSMSAALSKIARIERYSYGIEWNKLGAIFYGGLARQVELTKERKASPPDPSWVGDAGLSEGEGFSLAAAALLGRRALPTPPGCRSSTATPGRTAEAAPPCRRREALPRPFPLTPPRGPFRRPLHAAARDSGRARPAARRAARPGLARAAGVAPRLAAARRRRLPRHLRDAARSAGRPREDGRLDTPGARAARRDRRGPSRCGAADRGAA